LLECFLVIDTVLLWDVWEGFLELVLLSLTKIGYGEVEGFRCVGWEDGLGQGFGGRIEVGVFGEGRRVVVGFLDLAFIFIFEADSLDLTGCGGFGVCDRLVKDQVGFIICILIWSQRFCGGRLDSFSRNLGLVSIISCIILCLLLLLPLGSDCVDILMLAVSSVMA